MVASLNAPVTPVKVYDKPLTKPGKFRNITISDGEIGLSLGNMKLPYSTAIWNVPAVVTCPGAGLQGCGLISPDGKKLGPCYAIKAERMYPGVIESRERNLKASLRAEFLEQLWLLVLQAVTFRKIKVDMIRVHEAGDYYNQAYLDVWIEIARRLKRMRRKLGRLVKVYSYTKSIDLDFSKRPDNMIVLLSDDRHIWKDQWHRFDRVFGIENPLADFKCGEDCSVCVACVSGPFHISVRKH